MLVCVCVSACVAHTLQSPPLPTLPEKSDREYQLHVFVAFSFNYVREFPLRILLSPAFLSFLLFSPLFSYFFPSFFPSFFLLFFLFSVDVLCRVRRIWANIHAYTRKKYFNAQGKQFFYTENYNFFFVWKNFISLKIIFFYKSNLEFFLARMLYYFILILKPFT